MKYKNMQGFLSTFRFMDSPFF